VIEQDMPNCALGLTTDTLSIWRDGGFQDEEEQRIRQHATTCAACQQRIDGFTMVAGALERQRELEPGDRVWRGVQDRISSQRRTGRILPRSLGWSWQSLVSAASIILVVGLLAYVLNEARTQRGVPAPMSTATSVTTPNSAITPTLTSSVITPGPRLTWRQAHLPLGIEEPMASLAGGTLAVAPNNGDVAYLCVAPIVKEGHAQETNAHIYVTHDSGQTWARGGDVPVGAQPQSDGKPFILECHIVVDATRPDRAVVKTQWLQAGEDGDISRISSFASFDYGAYWRKLVYPSPFAVGPKMASYGGAIYATGAAENPGGDQGLWVSRDQMKTWQALALPPNIFASDLWLNPTTGVLLIAADHTLFSSADSGAHWAQLPAPSSAGIPWLVQPPQGSAPWRICGAMQANTLTCSGDGGQTWTPRPALNLAQNSPKGFQFFAPTSFFALASDGAVLATILPVDGLIALYRLPPGGSSWQNLGPIPADPTGATYAPTPTGGAIWLSNPDVDTGEYPPA
jgi:hypothetical protein